MKKMTMAALAATALLALSCSDDENDTTTSPIEGKWKIASIIANRAADINGDGTESTDLISEIGSCLGDSFMEFRSDKTVTISIATMPEEGAACTTTATEGTYKSLPNAVTTEVIEDGVKERVSYTKSGNLLRIDVPDFYDTLDAKIIFKKE